MAYVIVATPIYHHPTAEFLWSLLHLEGRDGFVMVKGVMLAAARRDLIERALVYENVTHVLMADADLAFSPDALTRLLAHDVDVAAGIYPARRPPYTPLVYTALHDMFMFRVPPTAQASVDAIPCGFMLVRRGVFTALDERFGRARWFEGMPGLEPDLSFCRRVTACGFKILCDPRIHLYHSVDVMLDLVTAARMGSAL